MKLQYVVAKNGFKETEAKVAIPMSEVVPLEFHELIEGQKTAAAPVEVDVRDAKRRISAMKAPKRKEVPIPKDESSMSEDEVEA